MNKRTVLPKIITAEWLAQEGACKKQAEKAYQEAITLAGKTYDEATTPAEKAYQEAITSTKKAYQEAKIVAFLAAIKED